MMSAKLVPNHWYTAFAKTITAMIAQSHLDYITSVKKIIIIIPYGLILIYA